MKVVIVAKTRMDGGAAVGALTFDGRSVRIIEPENSPEPAFQIGEVWEISAEAAPSAVPPHGQDVVASSRRQLPPIEDLEGFIQYQMPPISGGPEALFEGLCQADGSGLLSLSQENGLPDRSAQFWSADQPLSRLEQDEQVTYQYPGENGGRLLYTGFEPSLPTIPAGTLLCVSLGPSAGDGAEPRFPLTLCGWYNGALPSWEPVETTPEPLPENPPAADLEMSTALKLLKRVFGYDQLRSLQPRIIENVLAHKDSLAIMPTGSGKSLCYQLPALMFPGMTVVVSPLISLMQDQVEQLRQLGVAAVYLNSSLSYEEYGWTVSQIRQNQVKLLYVAPETLLRQETLALLEGCQAACLTIDEAHCISEWGHDFRPEYRQLADVRRRLPGAVCLAVTATATEQVREDIASIMGIDASNEFVASFNRENLFLSVEPKTEGIAQTLTFLRKHQDESGIIYCSTRRQVENVTDQLCRRGFSALPYHAGLDDEVRRENQRRFSFEESIIMVATVAFGMGIDKSNVRFIIHYDLPKNLESYYQQIGRAGRDGLPADCLLLFSYSDVETVKYFISQNDPDQRRGAQMRLEAMIQFANSKVCRRRPLLTYFGEAAPEAACDTCDICTMEHEAVADVSIQAQKFLSCVIRTGEYFGMSHIIDVLRGSQSQKVRSKGHDRLSTYGVGKEYSKKEWQQLGHQFIQLGLLKQDMSYGSLRMTEDGYEALRGGTVMAVPPVRSRPAPPAKRGGQEGAYDRALFERLRAKRLELAKANNVPPYVIFSDRTLVDMAARLPQTDADFVEVYGVGEAKLEKYVPLFRPVIQAFLGASGPAAEDDFSGWKLGGEL